jgi:hypothetical protein
MAKVMILIDWENVRRGLLENYVETVSVDQVMDAFTKVAKEIGELDSAKFFGDFTLRREEARAIGNRRLFYTENVLRSRSIKDQADPTIIATIMELIFTDKEISVILLGAGDSSYCDVVRRVVQKGKDVRICAVALDVSTDLASLAPLFPIEKYLEVRLTRRTREAMQPSLPSLSPKEISRWLKLVKLLYGLESRLPFVALNYLLSTIMPSYRLGGQTKDDRFSYLETARESGIVAIEEIDNPARPGYKMWVVKLNREAPIVKEILSIK